MLQDLALKGLARLSSEKRVASKELVASKERVASTAAGGTAMEPSTNMAYVHWLLGKTPFKESVKELPCNAVVPRASDGYALKVLKELNWCHATKQNTMDSIEPEYVLLMELSFFVFTDIAMGGSRGAQEILADLDLSVDCPVEDILKNWRDKLPPTNTRLEDLDQGIFDTTIRFFHYVSQRRTWNVGEICDIDASIRAYLRFRSFAQQRCEAVLKAMDQSTIRVELPAIRNLADPRTLLASEEMDSIVISSLAGPEPPRVPEAAGGHGSPPEAAGGHGSPPDPADSGGGSQEHPPSPHIREILEETDGEDLFGWDESDH